MLMYGVPQDDDTRAHMWRDIAASSGDEAASELRGRLAKRMTSTRREIAGDLSVNA